MKIQLFIIALIFSSCSKIYYVTNADVGNQLNLETGKSNANINSEIINNYILESKATTVYIYIPPGDFFFSQSISNRGKRIIIEGKNKLLSSMNFIGNSSSFINIGHNGASYLYGCSIRNISITGNSDVSLLKLSSLRGLRLENCNLAGGDIAINVDFFYDAIIRDCYISKFKKIGINITSNNGSNTTMAIEDSHIEGSGDGIHISGILGLRIHNTIFQSNKYGIVEVNNSRESFIYITSCHFEGNKYECFKSLRFFEPQKGPSFVSIENSLLLRGEETPKESNVIYLNFGGLFMKNTNVSYQKGISREAKSIGASYAIDVVENCIFTNPVREVFNYKPRTKQ